MRCPALLVLLCVGSHPVLSAQEIRPNWQAGAGVFAGLVIGGGEVLDGGLGIVGFGSRRISGPAWVRVELRTVSLDASSNLAETAGNRLTSFAVGPALETTWPGISLYLQAYAGLAHNSQTRSGSALPENSSTASLFGGSAGTRIWLGRGDPKIGLDIGLDVLAVGTLELARTGELGGTARDNLAILALGAGLTLALP